MGRLWDLLLPVLVINIAYIGYGISAVLLRFFGKVVNPITYLNVRTLVGVPIVFMAAAIAERSVPARPRSLLEAVLLLGIGINVALFTICGVVGVLLAGVSISAVMFMTAPAASTFIAIVTRTEPFPPLRELRGWAKIGGIVVTVAGAILLVIGERKQDAAARDCHNDHTIYYDSDNVVFGTLLCLFGVMASGFYFVFTKRFFMRYPHWKGRPTSSTAWITVGAAISFLAMTPIGQKLPHHTCSGEKVEVDWAHVWSIPGEGIYALEYATVFNACLAIMLMSWVLTRLPASVTAAFTPVGQVAGITLAAIVLGEHLTALQYGSIVFIIAGLLSVVWAQYKEESLEKAKKKEKAEEEKEADESDSLEELADDVEADQLKSNSLKLFPRDEDILERTDFSEDIPLTEFEEEDEL